MKTKTLAMLAAGTIVVGVGAAIAIATPTVFTANSIRGFWDEGSISSQSDNTNSSATTADASRSETPTNTSTNPTDSLSIDNGNISSQPENDDSSITTADADINGTLTDASPTDASTNPTDSSAANMKYTDLEPKPDPTSLNPGLTSPSPDYMRLKLGVPGQLTNECSSLTDSNLKNLMVTESVGPFRVTGLRPAVAAVRRVFEKVKLDKPTLYEQLGTAGMLCVRKVRGGSDFSNHSWGTAIDIKINNRLDARGDNKTQVGLKELYPYFQAESFYWGAAFPTEDSMHFEASEQLIEQWKTSGEIP